jgi:non-heme chloroperoxidase
MHRPNDVEFAKVHLATGLRLHYAEQGDREGEAIVFLHAYVDSWFSYSRVLPLLSPAYHAFAPDQRGHGESDRPQCCYTTDDYAADVDAFMETVGIEEATIVLVGRPDRAARRAELSAPPEPPRPDRFANDVGEQQDSHRGPRGDARAHRSRLA